MERMSEHTGLISSYQLHITAACTQVARWKAATPEQLTGAHLYLDIAKSGYLFHGYSGGMRYNGDMQCHRRSWTKWHINQHFWNAMKIIQAIDWTPNNHERVPRLNRKRLNPYGFLHTKSEGLTEKSALVMSKSQDWPLCAYIHSHPKKFWNRIKRKRVILRTPTLVADGRTAGGRTTAGVNPVYPPHNFVGWGSIRPWYGFDITQPIWQ